MSQIPTDLIQNILSERQLDGWLLYDFHGQNPIAKRVARFPEDRFATRRWFYFLPAKGEPVGIVAGACPFNFPAMITVSPTWAANRSPSCMPSRDTTWIIYRVGSLSTRAGEK